MRKDKKNALELRKQGKSYQEIKEMIGVPKSTLSDWLSPLDWSKNIKESLKVNVQKAHSVRIQELNKIRGEHLKRVYKEAEKEALVEFEDLKYHPLFIAGMMLYWGEGDKVTKHHVRLVNTEPKMVEIFINFLLFVCQADKKRIKCSLFLYPELDEQECKKHWMKYVKFDERNFTKTIRLRGKHKTKRVRYGMCNVTISSSYLKKKMLIWKDLLSEELITEKYYKNADIV